MTVSSEFADMDQPWEAAARYGDMAAIAKERGDTEEAARLECWMEELLAIAAGRDAGLLATAGA